MAPGWGFIRNLYFKGRGLFEGGPIRGSAVRLRPQKIIYTLQGILWNKTDNQTFDYNVVK